MVALQMYMDTQQVKNFPTFMEPMCTLPEARCSIVVKALFYEPEGHGFETRWGEWHFFQFT
jgi:hypothetical protein